MKKIFTLLSVVTLAVGANAYTFQLPETLRGASHDNSLPIERKVTAEREAVKPAKAAPAIQGADTKVITGMKRVSSNPLEAEKWVFTFGDYYNDDATHGEVAYMVDAMWINGVVYFTTPMTTYDYILPFFAEYNEEESTLTFPRSYLSPWQNAALYQEPFIYNFTTEELDVQDLVTQYDAAAGTITFPEYSGMAWTAYNDDAGEMFAYYFDIYEFISAVQEKNEPPVVGDWIDAGTATLMDGWVLPAFDIDQTLEANWYEVPLEQNTDNPNLYRLVNPYLQPGCPIKSQNLSPRGGYILIDVTDPAHVVINGYGIEAGLLCYDVGITEFYCYNLLGNYLAKYPNIPREDILNMMTSNNRFFTTFEDNVINLPSRLLEDGNYTNDANFGMQTREYLSGGMGWMGMDGLYLNMEGKIFFPVSKPGSAAVELVETQGACVKYFDLQGREVSHPESGSIYIRVEGSKASKLRY